jgi:hypothetical protein
MTTGLAGAAQSWPCHPDLPGTRVLTVSGEVTEYAFARGGVAVSWRRDECAGTEVWDYGSNPRATASASCGRQAVSTTRRAGNKIVASQGNWAVRLVFAPPSVDRPDRLDVFDRATHRRIASWPLIEHAARVDLYGDIAILSASKRNALYALGIGDGRIAMIGISRAGDRPLIGRDGVLYEDNLLVSNSGSSQQKTTLKLVPLAAVRRELGDRALVRKPWGHVVPHASHAGRHIRLSRINAISMDGPRVALAVHDPRGACDQVLFWNVAWHFVSRLTRQVGPTCLPTHASGGITDVAISGPRAVWTTQYGRQSRVLAASIIHCHEWVVARPIQGVQRVAGLSGDNGVLAYALGWMSRKRQTSSVGVVPRIWRGLPVARSDSQVVAVSADSGRVATVYSNGTAVVLTPGTQLVKRLRVETAGPIALRRDTLAVLGRRTLDVYSVSSGRRVHAWRVPASSRSVDLHYGIALITAGRDVLALNVDTGRTVRLLRAPTRVSAEIEAPGAVIQFNIGAHGYLRFVPMSLVEARTR